jgi:hypothetical protein
MVRGPTIAALSLGEVSEDSEEGKVLLPPLLDDPAAHLPRHQVTRRGFACFLGLTLLFGASRAFRRPSSAAFPTSGEANKTVALWSESLFCFEVMMEQELPLIQAQIARSISTFSCDEGIVLSNHRGVLGYMGSTAIQAWVPSTPFQTSGKGAFIYNSQNFKIAWDTLLKSGRVWAHPWTVKSDPDCVYFADRLRPRLSSHTGQRVYFRNCPVRGGELWGAIEVFSKEALQAYSSQKGQCESQNTWNWGEDRYMGQSMTSILHVQAVDDWNQVAAAGCSSTWANCGDGSKVGFHPFKDRGSFENCVNQAQR